LPRSAWRTIEMDVPTRKYRTPRGYEQTITLVGHLDARSAVLFDERQMTYIVGRIEMKRMRRSLETDEYHLNHVRQRVNGSGS
jgi:hypothetical protein